MFLSNNKNFSVEYNTRLSGFVNGDKNYFVSYDGKIKTGKTFCPHCGCLNYVDNGYHQVENSLIISLGLKINIAQFCCKKCGTFWSSNRELIDDIIQKEKDFVKSLLIGAARQGLSFGGASSLVEETVGHTYSPQYLHELYTNALDQFKQEKFCSASGVYYYDEQFLLADGKEVCRLTLKDVVTNKVIIDKQTENAQKETIKKTLFEALNGLPVNAFIVDMNRTYPELIHELYPQAKIQWCIFHLYKLIWKEFHDEVGKKLSLVQLYNAYTLFDIFFDHSLELQKLDELLKKCEKYKTNDQKSNREIEQSLRQEFGEFVKNLKKKRRREHKLTPRRTLNQSEKIFNTIKYQSILYPKKLQKRIQSINDNWEKFTLFQHDSRVQPTTNGIEHYFAATLSKTDKKDFRSKAAVTRELNACRAEWNGHKLLSTTKLTEVLNLVGMLFLAFPPS